MDFVIGKKYRFVNNDTSQLVPHVRGKVFIPIEITNDYVRIHLYDKDGSLIPSHSDVEYWTGDEPNSLRWDYQVDKYYSDVPWGSSKLEFKFS
jgi:hypothetical protein